MLTPLIKELRLGSLAILIDDASEQQASYIFGAAQSLSSEAVCQMVNHGGGVICVAVDEKQVKALGLPMMNPGPNSSSLDLTVSVEARQGVTTGISASDRARTIRTLANTTDPKLDLVMPGHIFPIRSKDGGVLIRSAPAEAVVDLMKLAGLKSSAAICHCLNKKGEILIEKEAEALAKKAKLPVVRISEIVSQRLRNEPILEKVAEANLPLNGDISFKSVCFRSKIDDAEHLALYKGDISKDNKKKGVLVRVQAENRITDLLGNGEFPSQKFLASSLKTIEDEGCGLFIYIRHPRQGLMSKKVKELTDGATPSAPRRASQLRELGIGAQILSEFGIEKIRLLSNSTHDFSALNTYNIEIVEKIRFGHA